MPLTTFSLNGVPIENYGLGVTALQDWVSVPMRQYAAAVTPLRPGAIPLGTASQVASRVMGLGLYIQATSLTDRRTKLNALLQQLGGKLEIISAEDPTKLCYGYLSEMPVVSPFRPFVTPEVIADLRLTCFDPLWYDVEPSLYGTLTPGVAVAVPVGSAPMRRLRYQVGGAATNPVVILRRRNTVEIARMSFTVTLGANDYLDVDCDAYSIFKYTGVSQSNGLGALATTDGFFLVDEPTDVEMTCSSGALTLTVYRSWWS